jgi:Fur family zinc uptake transcriptional regulator
MTSAPNLRLAKLVVTELEAERGIVKAYGLARRLSEQSGRRIAPNSIYRILDKLVISGDLRRVASRNGFMVSAGSNAILLICERCHSTQEVSCPDVEKALRDRALKHGFRPTTLFVEVLGICQCCTLHEPSSAP